MANAIDLIKLNFLVIRNAVESTRMRTFHTPTAIVNLFLLRIALKVS